MERATFVIRELDLTIQIPGLLKVAEALVVCGFRKENVRIFADLKRYVSGSNAISTTNIETNLDAGLKANA